MQDLVERFNFHVGTDEKPNQIAVALLILADEIRNAKIQVDETLGHEICMGLRHGLFGSGASNWEDVRAMYTTDK